VRFSPTDAGIAARDALPPPDTGANTYLNYVLNGAAAGQPVCWLDDSRLLVYRFQGQPPFIGYFGASVVDSTGVVITTLPTVPPIDLTAVCVGANAFYDPGHNRIYDSVTGNVIWSTNTPIRDLGTIAGGYVVFASGSKVVAESR